MAGFLDKVGSMAKTAADKTSDAIEITKLNSKISKEKDRIKLIKIELAERFLAAYESGELEDEFVAEKSKEIAGCEENIEAITKEIEMIKSR